MATAKRTATNRSTGKKTTTYEKLTPTTKSEFTKGAMTGMKASGMKQLKPLVKKKATRLVKGNSLSSASARKEQIAVKSSKRKVY